jgi:putative oxidoreductase
LYDCGPVGGFERLLTFGGVEAEMKIAALIAQYLLALVFVVFGLNGFLNFIPTGPMPTGTAGQYIAVMTESHYMLVVSALQVLGGLLLLANRYVPLGLTILGPVIANILLFHSLMAPSGLPLAIVVAILWVVVVLRYRQNFAGLFAQRAA